MSTAMPRIDTQRSRSESRRRRPVELAAITIMLAILWSVPVRAAGDGDTGVSGASSGRAKPANGKAGTISLTVTGWNGVQKKVAAHRGKVVLVDIWTTTCPTCVERLPAFVALQRRYGADRVRCVTVNCDYDGIPDMPPAHYRERVMTALRKSQAKPVDNLMLDISFLDFLELIDLSSTPAVLVYDQRGKLLRRFDNDDAESEEEEFTDQHVIGLVDRLIRIKSAKD